MKIKFIFFLFIAFYLAIIVRLFFLQVIYSPLNKSEYLKTNKLYPVRGRIYDLKNQSLVLNQNSYQLYIEPKKIADKDKLLQLLSKSLEVEEASISAKLNMSKNWVAIFAGITQEQKDKIDKLNLKGIGFDYQTNSF